MHEFLEKVRLQFHQSFLDSQTHSEKLVRTEVPVDAGVKFGPMSVLSEICLPHGLTPGTCTLLDTAGFKIDRVLFKSKDSSTPRECRTGDEFCVKLLGLYSRSQRKLSATRQVRELRLAQVTNHCSRSPEVLSRVDQVEADFTQELRTRLRGIRCLLPRKDCPRCDDPLGP